MSGPEKQFREGDWTADQLKRGDVVMTPQEMEEYLKRKGPHPDSFAGDIDEEEEKTRIDEE